MHPSTRLSPWPAWCAWPPSLLPPSSACPAPRCCSCPPPVECGARDPHSAAPRGTAGALAPSVCGAVTFPLA
ncbi:hypothetical protein PF005_g30527 [Phytophthora fragariae]|uniref:Uncharacterized protein n=1 Tax=Phytophthora fragariae TaxID=53985 RepID=A0A6A3VD77_9STRA|nr:hypothetical protein PF010_g30616 [Phytophthora fragariae]KAE9163237.1 hypothetical protein PF005_g30527 [Phytophthora fragariae]